MGPAELHGVWEHVALSAGTGKSPAPQPQCGLVAAFEATWASLPHGGMETSGEGGSGGAWLGQGEDVRTYREASLSRDERPGLGTGTCREGEEGPEAARHIQTLLAGNFRSAAGEQVPRGLADGKDLHPGFRETVTSLSASPPSSLLYRVGFCIQQTPYLH